MQYINQAFLVNYQEQGIVALGKDANLEIQAARRNTPTEVRDLYRSYIKYQQGSYVWGWVLK